MSFRQEGGAQPGVAEPRLDAAQYSQRDLLTCMCHAMRTPLSAILGFAQLMDSGKPAPTIAQQKNIERILEAGWYLEKLMNMTRDLALIESGTLALSLQPVPLAALMLDCQAMIESQAAMRGVRVTFPLFERIPWSVLADRVRLHEVLGHLLAAAIAGSEVDGTIVVLCEARGTEWIRIGIHDSREASAARRGTQPPHPFDGLEQAAVADGTAIGLLLAGRLVELMGGAIGAARIAGGGTVFSIDLKRILVPLAAGHAATHSVGEPTP